jgi:hypothetical protein
MKRFERQQTVDWLAAAAGLNLPRPSDKPKRGRQIQQLKFKKKNKKNEGKEELYSGIQAWEIRDLHGILSITSI